jgi:hypothetical protein
MITALKPLVHLGLSMHSTASSLIVLVHVLSFLPRRGVCLVSVWALGFGLDAYWCDIWVLYPFFSSFNTLFLKHPSCGARGLVWSGLLAMEWM